LSLVQGSCHELDSQASNDRIICYVVPLSHFLLMPRFLLAITI
jgi:hypothetical protein